MENLMRKIKKIDKLAEDPSLADLALRYSRSYILSSIKAAVAQLRADIREGLVSSEEDLNQRIIRKVLDVVKEEQKPHLKRVINCTGTVLHTNLGRAILSKRAKQALFDTASDYSNLELNLETGKRGSRYDHITDLLRKLTGAEDALVVNNNAAAVLLILTSLCKGKEAILSRGELVEIGGSFRIPSVMDFGGALLKEIGTTNKTHLSDYENALSEETGLLVKVHNSNYTIEGFTKSIEAEELATLARKKRVPLYYDLGSGALFDFGSYGILEPTVGSLVKAGVDILSFSGDKLLGGPQGGIIVGKRKLIAKIKKNQLLRAVRVDKLTLAALEATLLDYLDDEGVRCTNPTLNMLTLPLDELKIKGDRLLEAFSATGLPFHLEPLNSLSGGGSLPDKTFPSWCLTLTDTGAVGVGTLAEALRKNSLPIIVRVREGALILDVRTIPEEEFPLLVEAFMSVYRRHA